MPINFIKKRSYLVARPGYCYLLAALLLLIIMISAVWLSRYWQREIASSQLKSQQLSQQVKLLRAGNLSSAMCRDSQQAWSNLRSRRADYASNNDITKAMAVIARSLLAQMRLERLSFSQHVFSMIGLAVQPAAVSHFIENLKQSQMFSQVLLDKVIQVDNDRPGVSGVKFTINAQLVYAKKTSK